MLSVTLKQVIARWSSRRDELRRLGAFVDGVKLCDEVLADLTAVVSIHDEVLTLTEAARHSGYSSEHLGRLVRDGKTPNAGRPNAPRIRVHQLPCKAGHLPPERVPKTISEIGAHGPNAGRCHRPTQPVGPDRLATG